MKKKIISAIILSTMVLSNAAVFAAENEPLLISPASTEDDVIVGAQVITVDSEAVDLSKSNLSQYIYEKDGNVIVPLRAVAEKMGYTVGWNADSRSVTVGDDTWEVLLYMGEDSYVGVSKTEIGMTAPQNYGTAPELIEDTTFVPAKMFELLNYNYNAIGQFVDFKKISDEENENAVQIPNPFVPYESIDAVKKVLSFDPIIPSVIPNGYDLSEISSVGNDFLQIVYTDRDDNKIIYRMLVGNNDISGDYNQYTVNKELNVNDLTVLMRGNDKISNAVWTNGEFAYAIYSDNGLQEDEVINIIKNLK